MNVESEAIKVLAESLVKAYGKVVEQNNKSYVNNQIKNYPGGTGIGGGGGGSYSGSINVSQIRGFVDGVINAVAAEFETATIGTAFIDNLYGQYAEFIHLVADEAYIGVASIDEARIDVANINTAAIGSATIGTAQIKISSTDTAFIREGIGGKQYIDSLAVSEGNIVSLSVGNLLLNNTDGELVRIYVDGSEIKTAPVSYDGDDIINTDSLDGSKLIDNSLNGAKVIEGTVSGSKLIANTITTQQLNASEIFAKNAVIMDLIADNINATKLFANEGFIPTLTTTIIQSQQIGDELDISNNSSIILTNERIESVVSNIDKKTATYVQTDPPENPEIGDVWFNPTSSFYYVAQDSTENTLPTFAYDDDGNLVYMYEDGKEEYEILVNEEGNLVINGPDNQVYIIIDGVLSDIWKPIENQAFSQVSQTANKIEWIVASGTSASDMTLTDEALSAIANNIDLTANESIRLLANTIDLSANESVKLTAQDVSIETLNTLVRVDDNGLHIGEVDSGKEVLIDEESLSVMIDGQTYSRFASNYAQFGNYRIYNDVSGGLVFKMV